MVLFFELGVVGVVAWVTVFVALGCVAGDCVAGGRMAGLASAARRSD